MKKLFALVLAVSGSAASAQTPTTNPMPDGSRDMYAGLGVVSAPRYEGADSRKTSVLPVLQVQWSNGVFISGMSAGMHLSSSPTVEYGPLLAVHPRRTESGTGGRVGGVEAGPSSTLAPTKVLETFRSDNPLAGMDEIKARPEAGAFFNYYLAPEWRLTSSVLAGAGNDRNGVRGEIGVQRLAMQLAPHHTVSVSAGVSFANRAYQQSYFGVSAREAATTGHRSYRPDGGVKDVRIGARWNWALSPSWMLTSSVQATRLAGDARRSPLVERPTNVTVSTAFAYRF
ncbi:MipA/OmpV family protein [Massilia sp. IC2-477]|uniref:MipA/OmpV family protein n=1 Tax=unclassified Massilia TaxID=2609279 RepID=UPI001D113B6B|nr:MULTISPECIES: MipA/OmpV family protein [unclassified Massilia]MCC2954579.1 MipA/OmpV family protein [Massilia sp. IC2-477]MCC2971995.1 MipA/OmpV family protein [Massilia sp. IC2-476]